MVRLNGLEPLHLSAYAPQTYVSTIPPQPHSEREEYIIKTEGYSHLISARDFEVKIEFAGIGHSPRYALRI